MQPGGIDGGIEDLYQDILLEHYKSPRNHQLLQDPDLSSEGFNPFCGDRVVLTAKMNELGQLSGVGFLGQGCAISQASASMMTEVIKGCTLEQVKHLVDQFKGMMQGKELSENEKAYMEDLIVLEGVKRFPIRIKCALLAWSTLQDAVSDYINNHNA